MNTYSSASDGEVAGSGVFYLAAIVLAAVVLLGSIWTDAPLIGASKQASAQQTEQVVVTASRTGHTS